MSIVKNEEIVDNICCIKESIRLLEEELQYQKDELLRRMQEHMVDEVKGRFGKASALSYTRGTLNTDKTEDVINILKRDSGVPVNLDDCKRFTDCNYTLVRRYPDTIIPTWDEHRFGGDNE